MNSTICIEPNSGLEVGHSITIQGVYKRRTFWQWVTMKKKQPAVFTVTDETPTTITVDRMDQTMKGD